MKLKDSSLKKHKSFLDEYIYFIKPKIEELDIYVKCNNESICIKETAELLMLSEEEIKEIIDSLGIVRLNSYAFFAILEMGSSEICKLVKRQLEIGVPCSYKPKDISYIYDIDLNVVEDAFKAIKRKEIEQSEIEYILNAIPASCSNIHFYDL